VFRDRGILPNWSVPVLGLAVFYVGWSLGHLASLTRADVTSTTLKTWKWWSFGVVELVDLTTATSVMVEKQRKLIFAGRYALKVAFSDRAEQYIGWWDPYLDTRTVKRRFEAMASQVGKRIEQRP